MRKLIKNNKSGFSLMELLIVIAIIGIMTSIILIYPNDKTNRQVEGAAREVAGAIREAQNYSLTGKNAGGCLYNFYATRDTGNYGISGCVEMNYTLKDSIVFKTTDNIFINFVIPWGTASGSINTPIVLTKGSSAYTICVNSAGKVTETKGEPEIPGTCP